jgi:hypothetical protein
MQTFDVVPEVTAAAVTLTEIELCPSIPTNDALAAACAIPISLPAPSTEKLAVGVVPQSFVVCDWK